MVPIKQILVNTSLYSEYFNPTHRWFFRERICGVAVQRELTPSGASIDTAAVFC
jgi:hypothetical protein